MLIPDLGSALIPLTEDTPDEVGGWPANHAHGSLPGCRGHLANYRAREGGKRKRSGVLRWVSAHGVCNEVWWRPYPTNLPPPNQYSRPDGARFRSHILEMNLYVWWSTDRSGRRGRQRHRHVTDNATSTISGGPATIEERTEGLIKKGVPLGLGRHKASRSQRSTVFARCDDLLHVWQALPNSSRWKGPLGWTSPLPRRRRCDLICERRRGMRLLPIV